MSGRPAVSGPLLRTGVLRDFSALGSVGSPVFASAPQLRATIRRQVGEDVAAMMAIPQINERGDTIDWYAENGSMVVPWSSASFEEKQEALPLLQSARETLLERAALLANKLSESQTPSKDQEVFIRLLPFSLQIPDDSHIYLVNGRPVVTFWGFTHFNAPPAGDTIRDLVLTRPVVPPVPPAAPAAAVPPPVAEVARRPWWRWLLWLLPLLLLLFLLLFLLRACSVPVSLNLPGLGPVTLPFGEAPTIPGLPDGVRPETIVPGMVIPGAVPGTVIPGVGVVGPDGTVMPDPQAMPNPDQANPNQANPDQANSQTPPPEAQPPETPTPETPTPEQQAQTPPQPPENGQTPATPPPGAPIKPLVLPPNAGADGNMDFMNGKWRSRTGLVDSATGLPVEMEYTFKDGKGSASVRRHDGTVCTAPADASMQGGQLHLNLQDATCPDGGGFGKAAVDCTPGAGGRAECKGTNADGSKFDVVLGQ